MMRFARGCKVRLSLERLVGSVSLSAISRHQALHRNSPKAKRALLQEIATRAKLKVFVKRIHHCPWLLGWYCICQALCGGFI